MRVGKKVGEAYDWPTCVEKIQKKSKAAESSLNLGRKTYRQGLKDTLVACQDGKGFGLASCAGPLLCFPTRDMP